jgi:hypothetical protein
MLSFKTIYNEYDNIHKPTQSQKIMTAMQHFCKRRKTNTCMSAFDRINTCRKALEALDRQGKCRSNRHSIPSTINQICNNRLEQELPPTTIPRAIHTCMRTDILQNRSPWHLPKRSSKVITGQRMAESFTGNTYLHA